jgi:hypothetical protein
MKFCSAVVAAGLVLFLVAVMTLPEPSVAQLRPLLLGRQCLQFERIQLASQIAIETLNSYGVFNTSTTVEAALKITVLGLANSSILNEATRIRENAASTAVVVSYGPEAAYMSQELSSQTVWFICFDF